jgi:hypothetical protein
MRVLGVPDDATAALRERSRQEVERYLLVASHG